MPIGRLFHVMHIVDDFDEAERRWEALLSPDTYAPKRWSDFDKRWASLAYVGPDFVLEIMEPSTAEEDRTFPLPKFHQRFGERWHSFAWFFVDGDLSELLERFWVHGVRVAGPRGLLEKGAVDEVPRTIFTHPRDTGGQIEFQALGASATGPMAAHERRPATFWSEEHPLGVLRLSHLTTGCADLERAKALWTGPIGGSLFFETTGDAADGAADGAFVLVGDETVVELARPTSGSTHLAQDLARHGELPHAVTFQVADLERAERHVEAIGMRVAERRRGAFTVEPADLCGARVRFTDEAVPGDPRGPGT
jgi:catechol 2,3-dioxygenase-like lactoylglutathione lyase family enzyme